MTKKEKPQAIQKSEDRLSSLIQSSEIKARFEEMMGKRAASFISSVISATSSNANLKKCEPMSVISAAVVAATLDLPINPSLGFAHIIPYGDKAQFQIGWKGIIQLAMRSGQYRTINITPVLEGQLKKHDQFTGEMEFNQEAISEEVIGYLLYFKLLNGYEKYFYMTKEQCKKHGKRYSKTFARNQGPWVDDFDAMSLKTVVKMGLSKYGILSVEMQKAIEVDQGVIQEGLPVIYPDAPESIEVHQEPKTKSSRLTQLLEKKPEEVAEEKTSDPLPAADEIFDKK